MQDILESFWDSVCALTVDDCRAILDRIANDYARPDMAKRFREDLGGAVRARYFRRAVAISRRDDISSLWPTSRVDVIEARIIFDSYEEPLGYRVEGRPREFSCLFVEEEGDAAAEIVFNGKRKTLFFTRRSELLVLGR